MGSSYIFKCKKCDYEVQSSGELDYGFFAVVKPFTCSTCEDVFDVQIGETGHTNIATTERYCNIPLKRLEDDFPSYAKQAENGDVPTESVETEIASR